MLLIWELRAPVRLAEPSRVRSTEESTWTFPGNLSASMVDPGMAVAWTTTVAVGCWPLSPASSAQAVALRKIKEITTQAPSADKRQLRFTGRDSPVFFYVDSSFEEPGQC